ncbi:MAG: carboxypeptidase-like regulatory domain-containing protein [Saprospiraceae bacterium]|nr:carboxypeptidase-like regulatory domain-containing protein [Saprospiraceae bacterium]
MKLKALFTILLLTPFILNGQGIQGSITDQNGSSLPFATVYVLKLQRGTASNEEGRYQLSLPRGTYEVRFQFLGYTTKTVTVQVGNGWEQINIELAEEPIELQTIEVLDNREDPAYTIMRRAIGKASYHAQQLDAYSATSYIKGSGRLKDLPGLFRKRIEKALEEEGIDTSTAFVTESVSEISYQRPNQFSEKVISVRTIGEDNNTSPNNFINASFYNPEINGAVSPLSPKAFAYYKFEYLGFFADHGMTIDKIKVTPRSPGDKVFEGTIYIVDQEWNIHSLDLTTYIWGIKFNINQVYQPIQEHVWLPVDHTFFVSGSFFGFEFEYTYFAHIQDYQITLNPDLPAEVIVLDDKLEKEKSANADQAYAKKDTDSSLAALASGKDISRKQLRKILRDYEKEEMQEEMEEVRDTTHVDVVQVTEYQVDSNAYKRDSLYWESIRPIPLTNYEVKGYARMDSISQVEAEEQASQDSISLTIGSSGTSLTKKKGGSFQLQDILFGGSYKAGKRIRWGWDSPLTTLHFNTVEGYHLAAPFFVRNSSKTFRWRMEPTIAYSFARNRWNGSLATTWSAGDPERSGILRIEGGRMTRAYNPDAISPIISDFASLLFERNFYKVYEQTYLEAQWNKQINSKHALEITGGIAERRGLENQTLQSYFDSPKRAYTSNFPENAELGHTAFDTSSVATFGISWKMEPWLKYRLRNHQKERIDHSSPLITLSYRTAIPGLFEHGANYHHLDAQFEHVWPGIRGDFSLKANLGTFINPEQMTIVDLKHFPGNRTIFTTADPVASYRLLDYYRYSTQSSYAAVFTHYQFRKLLVTQLPIVRLAGIREAAFVNALESKGARHYVEVGYGINYILRVFRIEAAASFEDGKYQDWGIRIGVASNLNNLFD